MSAPPSLLVDCRAALGEGLTWAARQQAWMWTDIEGARLWRHHPASGRTQSWRLPDRAGTFVVCRSGRVLLGLAKQLAWGTLDDAADAVACEPIVDVEPEQPTTRVNDGRTDRDGNFVFGTMDEAPGHPATAHLYQFSMRRGLRRLNVGTVGITNSIAFSPDGGTMYFCDSMTRRILCGEYDADAARVEGIRPFVVLAPEHGMPDGSIVDADGALWNAQWGGSAVRRYALDGTLLATSEVPAAHVTCPAFGGPSLDVLCTTTARIDIDAAWLDAHPETGGVFCIDAHDAKGIAEAEFADSPKPSA